jgi:hypothetical protein
MNCDGERHGARSPPEKGPTCTGRPSTKAVGAPYTLDSTLPVERVSNPAGSTARDVARRVLLGYRDGLVSLEGLIVWAEELATSAPADPWQRRTAESLADPSLCRERAMAFVRDLLGD